MLSFFLLIFRKKWKQTVLVDVMDARGVIAKVALVKPVHALIVIVNI